MSEFLVEKIEELRATGVRIFELIDEIEGGGNTNLTPRIGKTYSDFALAHVARKMIKQRQVRQLHLPAELFSEPAWDMLLDLFIAQMEQQVVSVTSACLATSVPATTALRWLDVMHNLGLVERYPSLDDKRVSFVRLTKSGRDALRRYLSAAQDDAAARQVAIHIDAKECERVTGPQRAVHFG